MSEELSDLNKSIAEQVMGLTHVEWAGAQLRYRNLKMMEEYGGTYTSPVPDYAGDIAAAMEVVNKMRERFEVEISTGTSKGWHVQLSDGNPLHTVGAGGPSLPDCICRAAVAAVQGEHGEGE